MSDVKFGDPFLFGVWDANLDGSMDDFAVDGHPGATYINNEAELLSQMRDSVQEHGGNGRVFLCVPIGSVRRGRGKKVIVDMAETQIERMVAAAAAMGE